MLPDSTPAKIVQCQTGCGTNIEYKTSKPKFCANCREVAEAERWKRAAAVQRRKKGIPLSRGVEAICAGCGLIYEKNGGRTTHCVPCQTERAAERARQRSIRLCRERGAAQMGETIICKNCATEFPRSASIECYCARCKLAVKKGHLPEQKLKMSLYQKERRAQKMQDPEFISSERTRMKKSREKRKANPAFTINERMSAAIRQNLAGGKKGWRWEKLVGYTLAELMAHLERQFLPGMTWQNRGSWHVDHISPLTSFTITGVDDPEFKRAWSLPNLRPLWAKDNLKKLNRITHLL